MAAKNRHNLDLYEFTEKINMEIKHPAEYQDNLYTKGLHGTVVPYVRSKIKKIFQNRIFPSKFKFDSNYATQYHSWCTVMKYNYGPPHRLTGHS